MISKEKIEQLKRDAEAGDASAQNSLACAYYNGDGIEKDIPAALELYNPQNEAFRLSITNRIIS